MTPTRQWFDLIFWAAVITVLIETASCIRRRLRGPKAIGKPRTSVLDAMLIGSAFSPLLIENGYLLRNQLFNPFTYLLAFAVIFPVGFVFILAVVVRALEIFSDVQVTPRAMYWTLLVVMWGIELVYLVKSAGWSI
jgi:hypothetical protein